jgi:hypothetical protein
MLEVYPIVSFTTSGGALAAYAAKATLLFATSSTHT